MYEYINQLLFGILPYDRDQYTWKAGSSQLLISKGMTRVDYKKNY